MPADGAFASLNPRFSPLLLHCTSGVGVGSRFYIPKSEEVVLDYRDAEPSRDTDRLLYILDIAIPLGGTEDDVRKAMHHDVAEKADNPISVAVQFRALSQSTDPVAKTLKRIRRRVCLCNGKQ